MRALREAVDIAELSASEKASIDHGAPVNSWPAIQNLAERLARRYSKLLNVRVDGERADYLLWNAVDLAASYPADAPPDCEHVCLAILAIEGAISNAASANWDGLIETAAKQLSAKAKTPLQVVVIAKDFRTEAKQTQLLKFHGCAALAVADPDCYRDAIIASEEQITNWPNDPAHELMLTTLKQLAVTKGHTHDRTLSPGQRH